MVADERSGVPGRRSHTGAVDLHGQTHARGFYQQLGYAAYGELFSEAGIEHISTRKELQ